MRWIAMSSTKKPRIFMLRLMYVLTIATAGSIGIGILVASDVTQWIFGIDCPRIMSGLIGSVFLAFALVSVLGLKDPMKFAPLLLMQLLYKSAWLCFVALPLLITGRVSVDVIPVIAVFVAAVIGDLIAIPFGDILKNTPEGSHESRSSRK
jgi:hypothetical protein